MQGFEILLPCQQHYSSSHTLLAVSSILKGIPKVTERVVYHTCHLGQRLLLLQQLWSTRCNNRGVTCFCPAETLFIRLFSNQLSSRNTFEWWNQPMRSHRMQWCKGESHGTCQLHWNKKTCVFLFILVKKKKRLGLFEAVWAVCCHFKSLHIKVPTAWPLHCWRIMLINIQPVASHF